METRKLYDSKEQDPEWIVELVHCYLGKNIKNLSNYQKKMLSDQYLDFLRDGLKSKDAIKKALEIVLCFS